MDKETKLFPGDLGIPVYDPQHECWFYVAKKCKITFNKTQPFVILLNLHFSPCCAPMSRGSDSEEL